MRRNLIIILILVLALSLFQCADDHGKLPLTCNSQEALTHYYQGRDLNEKLRGQEAITHFEQAVEVDPRFAIAWMNLAFVSSSAKEFFQHFDTAKSLLDKVSKGERLWINAVDDGINGYLTKQQEKYQQLVELYPRDERVQNLLATNYYVQQEYNKAISHYSQAVDINPEYSPAYNQLGYAHRFLKQYREAEIAFIKYVALIPNDPNPLDSYAELLMKMGRFDESVEKYQAALALDSNFVASYIGQASSLNFLHRNEQAREQLDRLLTLARNDGERRAAHFAKAVSFCYQGDYAAALEELEMQYQIAQDISDFTNMGADLIQMGNILLELGQFEAAQLKYDEALATVEGSSYSETIKDNSRRAYLYNSGRVAISQGKLDLADQYSSQFERLTNALHNQVQTRLAHELHGIIALAKTDFNIAIDHLRQSNLQNPYNLYRLGLAYQGANQQDLADDFFTEAKTFYALNSLNNAFVLHKQ